MLCSKTDIPTFVHQCYMQYVAEFEFIGEFGEHHIIVVEPTRNWTDAEKFCHDNYGTTLTSIYE